MRIAKLPQGLGEALFGAGAEVSIGASGDDTPRTFADVVRRTQQAIALEQRAIARAQRRLAALEAVAVILEQDPGVRRYIEQMCVVNDPSAGIPDPQPGHNILDDCDDEDCPIHAEQNKVRG